MGGERASHPATCCFCLHVRTGTVLIALWHMIGQVCAMLLIASMIFKNTNSSDGSVAGDTETNSFFFDDEQHDASDYCVGLVIVFCYFLITSMMIKGVAQYQSSYLLPFFCLQIFDFFITCLTAIGLLSYYPDFDDCKLPYSQQFGKWKGWLPEDSISLDNQWIFLVAFILFLVVMMVKAYCIACVWSCYKFIAASEIRNSVNGNNFAMDAEALMPKLPSYSDAIKTPSEKPPAYDE